MRLRITNVRRIPSADFPIGGITEIRGANEAAKSSAGIALAAALLRERAPLGYASTRPGRVIREGAEAASVRLDGQDGSVELIWPRGETGKVNLRGNAPVASKVAVGWAPLEPYRGQEWVAYLSAQAGDQEPTEGDAKEALEAGDLLTEGQVLAYLALLRSAGWDALSERLGKDALAEQNRWAAIAGMHTGRAEKYGVNKAAGWTPPGWREELADVPSAELERRVRAASDALATARQEAADARARERAERAAQERAQIKIQEVERHSREQVESAVAQERHRAEALIGEIDQSSKQKIQQAVTQERSLAGRRQELLRLQQSLSEIEGRVQDDLRCPHCKAQLMLLRAGARVELRPRDDGPEEHARRQELARPVRERIAELEKELGP